MKFRRSIAVAAVYSEANIGDRVVFSGRTLCVIVILVGVVMIVFRQRRKSFQG